MFNNAAVERMAKIRKELQEEGLLDDQTTLIMSDMLNCLELSSEEYT